MKNKSIISVDQFSKHDLEDLFILADEMRDHPPASLVGKVVACVFYEPSTRTSSSFIAATNRLGGDVIPITQGIQFSSVSKGESLEDTVKTLAQYANCIVLRHPEIGAAKRAAGISDVPIINAGDGAGEHPTQALLDLYTIGREAGKIDGLHVGMVGDLRFGRTVHSLTKLLLLYDVGFSFVSPEILRLPLVLANQVRERGKMSESEGLQGVIEDIDVLYVTRVQKERFASQEGYEQVAGSYVIDNKMMQLAKENMVLMHPLPRVGEILEEVDDDSRAAYFRQVENGMYVRMALLARVLS